MNKHYWIIQNGWTMKSTIHQWLRCVSFERNYSTKLLSGVFPPLTTPIDSTTGKLATQSLKNNVKKFLETPLNGFVVLGSSGEFPSLTQKV